MARTRKAGESDESWLTESICDAMWYGQHRDVITDDFPSWAVANEIAKYLLEHSVVSFAPIDDPAGV